MNTVQMKEFSKKRLAENRWPMVLVALIITLIGGFISFTTMPKIDFNYTSITSGGAEVINTVTKSVSPIVSILMFAFTHLIKNPLQVGCCHFFRKNVYQNAVVEDVLIGFRSYVNTVLTMFVMTIAIGIGIMLCVVPGVILALGLMLVPYIVAENPNLGVFETLTLSWDKMKGHKGEYLVLILSFIGWALLSIITLGLVGIFYASPYANQTFAAYADRILNEPVQEMNKTTWDGTPVQ
ncbi:MAG: DUF975 family protein [Firmicutes bacterium]|nr:DUF975 family protein [Bacillota bacterium]